VASLIGRREVMSGKAKFGILGDGKELPQLLWRMFSNPAIGARVIIATKPWPLRRASAHPEFFAPTYAHADVAADPASWRMMMPISAAQPERRWNLAEPDLPIKLCLRCFTTASQMPRAVGLAYASKLYSPSGRADSSSPNFPRAVERSFPPQSVMPQPLRVCFWESINASAFYGYRQLLTVYDEVAKMLISGWLTNDI